MDGRDRCAPSRPARRRARRGGSRCARSGRAAAPAEPHGRRSRRRCRSQRRGQPSSAHGVPPARRRRRWRPRGRRARRPCRAWRRPQSRSSRSGVRSRRRASSWTWRRATLGTDPTMPSSWRAKRRRRYAWLGRAAADERHGKAREEEPAGAPAPRCVVSDPSGEPSPITGYARGGDPAPAGWDYFLGAALPRPSSLRASSCPSCFSWR